MAVTTVSTTFLPLRYFLPDLSARLRTDLAADAAVADLVDSLFGIELPSPALPAAVAPSLTAWDVIGFSELTTRFDGTRLIVDGTLDVLGGYEPQFRLPGFDKLSVVVSQLGRVHVELDAEGGSLEVSGPSIALRFDPEWLRPAAAESEPAFAEIGLVELGYLTVDTNGAVDFGAVPGGTIRFVTNNDPWQIGESSVTLETGELDVILHEGPEGGPAVSLTAAALRFSEDLAAKDGSGFELALPSARIDPTGFTGTVSAAFPGTVVDDPNHPTTFVGPGAASLFGFEFGVSSIDLEFKSNRPARCVIAGGMILPFFDEAVTCTLGIGEDGEFQVAFADVDGDGLVQFTKEDVFRLSLTAFAIGRAGDVTTLAFSGDIELLRTPNEMRTVPKLAVQNLVINSRGEVSLEAGWLELNPAVTFDLIGFLLTIEKVGIGFDAVSLWVGITGGVTLLNGLPRATVEELRLIIPLLGGLPSVTLQGATIDADIGGSLQLFGGFHLLPKEEGVEGFSGDVRLTLADAGFGLDGSLLVGIQLIERYPFLYVFVGVELPAGIPLGPSGCALFGFAGLFGLNVAPKREADQSWYYDWYRGAPGPGATQSTKWRPQKDAFALGAGVTIGTQDGFTVTVRSILVITLPSFMIMIEGRAGYLTPRTKLAEDPPLSALVVFDPADGLLFALEAQYEFVANILFAHGLVEAYFPFTSGAWHVYLGAKPADRRIVADVLKKLFRADGYVMIDGEQTQIGGSIGYALDRKFGPARVAVSAGMSGEGTFAYDPAQLEASLRLYGSLRLSAFGVSIGFGLDAGISVRVPTPFVLSLHFAAHLNLCWPLDDIKVEFDVRWEDSIPPPYPAPLLVDAAAMFNVTSGTIALVPGQIVENVPLDARFALNFSHALSKPSPGDYPRVLDFPETSLHRVSPNDTFRYDLASLRLERLDSSGGVVETLDFDDSESPLFGHWQLLPVGQTAGSGAAPADSSRAPGGTLLLLARTPFEYLQSVWQPSDGTAAPADIPTYERVAVEPPASTTLNLCDEIGVSSDPGSDWLPGNGETADGIPDPAAPTETAAANGVVIVVHGFPETSGSNGRLSDPTGGPFQVDLEFPGPVVVTVVTVRPCQGFVGTTTFTLDGQPVAMSLTGLPLGLVDCVTFTGNCTNCGHVRYVDAAAWRAHTQAVDVNATRAAARQDYGTMALETLTDDAFILRPDSQYRLRLSITKSGGASESTEAHDTATTDLEFRTQATPPTDLRPYLFAAVPTDAEAPLFRGEETGVRFIETYLQDMFVRASRQSLSIRIADVNGVTFGGRRTEWRKAEDHIDRTGQLAYLTQVNEIYEAGITPSSLLLDDVLVSVPLDTTGSGVLPAGATFLAEIVANGPGAATEPLFTYRFRTSRYSSVADWASALPRDAGVLVDPGLPDSLWTGSDPLSIAEEALLPLFKEPLPATPLLRRMSRGSQPPVLVLTLPEPLALARVEFHLWQPAGATFGAAPRAPARAARASTYQVAFDSEYLVPLSRYSGRPAPNGVASAMGRLRVEKQQRAAAELANIPAPAGSPREVPVKAVWVEDGSRVFLIPTDAAEQVADGAYDLEIRYAHPLPDAAGNRVVDTVLARVEIPAS